MSRVLIACEFSGIVRSAFAALGHDAWSCDLLPSERPGQHIQGDVRDVLSQGWDLMIAHPPCQYLSYAGVAHWHKPGRSRLRAMAMQFFMDCYNAPIPMVCVENPRGLPMVAFRPPDQVIEPFFFGDRQRKRTCLWLRGLPRLFHSDQPTLMGTGRTHVSPPRPLRVDGFNTTQPGKARYFTDKHVGRSAKSRAATFPGIADAMAQQWNFSPLTPSAPNGNGKDLK